MDGIWYMLHCPKDSERKILHLCRENLNENLIKDVFVFSCERMKRYQGAWHLEKRSLFPDCIFLDCRDPDSLTAALTRIFPHTSFTERADVLTPVSREEQEALRELAGNTHCISMSKGVIRGGVTYVTEGPLKGKEQWIRKIDRHKRLALLDAKFFPDISPIKAGLEITEKTL